MPTNGYTSTSSLKSYLAITDTVDDTELNAAIDGASRSIDAHCARYFYQDSTVSALTYYPVDARYVLTDDISTTAGLVVKTDSGDTGTFDTTIAAANYQVEPLNGRASGLTGWPYYAVRLVESDTFPTSGRRARVQVTALWGWAAVPFPVVQACLLLSAELWKMKDAPFGVAGISDFGAIRVRDNPKVAALLAPYQRRAGVAVA